MLATDGTDLLTPEIKIPTTYRKAELNTFFNETKHIGNFNSIRDRTDERISGSISRQGEIFL